MLVRGWMALAVLGLVGLPTAVHASSGASLDAVIPAFARKYRTTCSTCHVAPPKLNVLGEAFRQNGYRFPVNDALLRRDRPVQQGADPWRELWPRAIWPGELPGGVPLALRLVNDVTITADPDATAVVDLAFPEEVYVLAGASLGETVSAFLSAEWTPSDGVEIVQAKVKIQNLVGALPDRALNLWVGLQNLYLFTLADRQIDRAARLNFRWQTFSPSDVPVTAAGSETRLSSSNRFRLRDTQPALELNGLAGGRLYYSLGVAQGAGTIAGDNNARKDAFYKVRYKLGGLRLDGTYDDGRLPTQGGSGQLRDRSLILEHFGYLGSQPVEGDVNDDHRAFGVNARLLRGPFDVALGYVWAEHDSPWGNVLTGGLRHQSLFGRAEVLVYPWLLASLKFDLFDAEAGPAPPTSALSVATTDQTRWMPGAVILLRHNVKAVIEGELFSRHSLYDATDRSRPHSVRLRLDVAF